MRLFRNQFQAKSPMFPACTKAEKTMLDGVLFWADYEIDTIRKYVITIVPDTAMKI